MDRRTDRLAAVQVDLAVNIALVFGAAAGAMSLLGQGVPVSVLQRVLIEGGPRRGARHHVVDDRQSAGSTAAPGS